MKIARQNDKTFHEKQLQCLKLGHHYIKNDMLAGAWYGAVISLRFSIRPSLGRRAQMRKWMFCQRQHQRPRPHELSAYMPTA